MPDKLDMRDYPTKLVSVQVNKSKKGLDKYVFSIRAEVRRSHWNDAVNGAEWRRMMEDFDKQLLDVEFGHATLTHWPFDRLTLSVTRLRPFDPLTL